MTLDQQPHFATACRAMQRELRGWACTANPEIDRLDAGASQHLGIAGCISLAEGLPDGGQSRSMNRASGQIDRNVMHLTHQAHVGLSLDHDRAVRHASLAQSLATLGLQVLQNRIHRQRVKSVSEFDAQRPNAIK